MGIDNTVLQTAISEVSKELSYVSDEQAAFEEFREAVRLTSPDSDHNGTRSETTKELRETYCSVVMDELDYNTTYGETLFESLTHELSPTLADVLISDKPLTPQRRRQLLVATAETIEGREAFREVLKDERSLLKSYSSQLSEIESILEKQPVCSVQEQTIETVLGVWKRYESLESRCEELLEERQHQLQEREKRFSYLKEWHTLNEYLYRNLEYSYPVLSAIAETCERINSRREGPSNTIQSGKSVKNQ